MYTPTALIPQIIEKARVINHNALVGQFSGLVVTQGSGALTATGQVGSGNFYSYTVDVDNTRLVPTSGTTGVNVKAYFLPGRFLSNLNNNESINLGNYPIGADYFICPLPEHWYPNDYPKGNYGDTPSGQWATYEYYPFTNAQNFYYIRTNSEYIAPAGGYVFREERVVLVKLGQIPSSSSSNFNFLYNDALMTYNSNPTRVRTNGLDKNIIINYIRRYKNKTVDQTLIL